MSTAFLSNPEKAREAIQVAVRLCKRRGGGGMAPPSSSNDLGMHRGIIHGGPMQVRQDMASAMRGRGHHCFSSVETQAAACDPHGVFILQVHVLSKDARSRIYFQNRLHRLAGLVSRGVLTASEADKLRVKVGTEMTRLRKSCHLV